MDRVGLVIPVVTQQDYYIEVFSSVGNVNAYSLEIENLAAPVPTEVTLDPVDDSGPSADDLTTFRTTQLHYYVHADLNDFAASGIPILSAVQAAAGVTAGAAVQVFDNGVSVGFADVVLERSTRSSRSASTPTWPSSPSAGRTPQAPRGTADS